MAGCGSGGAQRGVAAFKKGLARPGGDGVEEDADGPPVQRGDASGRHGARGAPVRGAARTPAMSVF
jgi:hypothetical protein